MTKIQTLLANPGVNIKSERRRHLGVVTGSTEYHDKYMKKLGIDWDNQFRVFSVIAETQPQAASYAPCSSAILWTNMKRKECAKKEFYK